MLPWFFLSNLIPFYGQDYEKEKGPGTMWPFESGKLGNEGGKLQKFQYLESKKQFLGENVS